MMCVAFKRLVLHIECTRDTSTTNDRARYSTREALTRDVQNMSDFRNKCMCSSCVHMADNFIRDGDQKGVHTNMRYSNARFRAVKLTARCARCTRASCEGQTVWTAERGFCIIKCMRL